MNDTIMLKELKNKRILALVMNLVAIILCVILVLNWWPVWYSIVAMIVIVCLFGFVTSYTWKVLRNAEKELKKWLSK